MATRPDTPPDAVVGAWLFRSNSVYSPCFENAKDIPGRRRHPRAVGAIAAEPTGMRASQAGGPFCRGAVTGPVCYKTRDIPMAFR